MHRYEIIRKRYKKETGKDIEGWVNDYTLWLEDLILKSVKKRSTFIPPTIDDVILYFKSKGYSESSARTAFDFYNVAEWADSNGKQIKNWKQKMIGVWFKPNNKESLINVPKAPRGLA